MNTKLIESLARELKEYGLKIRGSTELTTEEIKAFSAVGFKPVNLLLVGNVGSSLWEPFTTSAEYQDGEADPLDRWSLRIGESLAENHGALAVFPFRGPPYHPFLQWGKRCEPLEQSVLGMMMHPEYGLWHAYRFALLFEEVITTNQMQEASVDNCANCVAQPCLSACPAEAFSEGAYDVSRCIKLLKQQPTGECMSWSCRARLACPFGCGFQYLEPHGRFHMKAFINGFVGDA